MLCFRCGSPVEEEWTECRNCSQDLSRDEALDGGEVDALKEQLRRSPRSSDGVASYHVGEQIRGRYRVSDVIGVGPLGAVYKAQDTDVDVDVAVKVISGDFLPDQEAREHFLRHIGGVRQLVHNNIVRYFEVGADGERCFYVTQFLEGLSLRRIIGLRRDKGQRFSLAEVEPIVAQIAEALTVAKTTHGGLKPDNVIILPNLLKVTDLWLAVALPREPYLAAQRAAGGVVSYFAPEVMQGSDLGPAADVYSVGVIVIELLTGQVYKGGAVRVAELDDEFPPALDEVLSRAVAEDPAERFADTEAFAAALVEARGGVGKSEGDAPGADASPRVRQTLPFGSAIQEAGVLRPDATLRYGQVRPEDERPTLKMESQPLREASEDGHQGESDAVAQPTGEVTQTLDLDEVEVDEEREEEHPAAAQEGTQQLSLEDVEFASGSMALRDEEAKRRRHVEEVTVPRAVAGDRLAAAAEKTQQVDPLMIEGVEDDEDAAEETHEIGLPATKDSGGDYAAVSGETESAERALPAPKQEEADLGLPRRDRASAQEARARDVLQAFDRTEGTGRFEEMIEPADDPDGALDTTGALEDSAVVHGPAGPSQRTTTQVARTERPSRMPLLLAIAAGVVFGSGAVWLLTDGSEPSQSSRGVSMGPAAAAAPAGAPASVGAEPPPGPKVTSLAPVARAAPTNTTVDRGADVDQGAAAPIDAAMAATRPADLGAPASAAMPAAVAATAKKAKTSPGEERRAAPAAGREGPARAKKRVASPASSPKGAPKAAPLATPKERAEPTKVAKASTASKGRGSRCPPSMAHIRPRGGGDGYCIDRHEAPGRGRKPKVVSLAAARAACAARGARLCTTREWMKSCGGLFPYGRVFDAGRCNTGTSGTVAAGSKSGCRSPFGVYDLSGNVAEWVEEGAAMGGGFAAKEGHASCTARTRGGASTTGYRCCADPEWEL